MKKILIAISALFYLAISSGVIVNMHYCMKRLDSVQFYAKQDDLCGKCGMDTREANGCCHDEIKVFKITDDQQPSLFAFHLAGIKPMAAEVSLFLVAPYFSKKEQIHFCNHSPPLLSAQDTYLQQCVFRI